MTMPRPELVLLTGSDCHLCVHGREVLATLGDGNGVVRFHQDYPNMWVEPTELLHALRSAG
jgi:hypothetical protein